MSLNGDGQKEIEPKRGGWVSSRRPDPESTPRPNAMTPEQGCIGCSVGVGLFLVAFLFWAWVYWRYEPSFHPNGQTPPIPFSQAPKKRPAVHLAPPAPPSPSNPANPGGTGR